jgi:hypothetical protein
MIPICLVGGASDDERDLGSGKSIGAELALHGGARREVDLLRVRGRLLFAMSADRESVRPSAAIPRAGIG